MSRTGLLTLIVLLTACTGGDRDPMTVFDPIEPRAAALRNASPTAEACLTDARECPSDDWVFLPADLDPNIPQSTSNCDFTMFGLAPTIPQWDLHPSAACREKQWGQSGIYRQQARDIHVTGFPRRCNGES